MKPFIATVDYGLKECFSDLERVLEGLSEAELNWRPTLQSNTIGWLVWHMARVEDNWLNIQLQHRASLWERANWAAKTGIETPGNGWGQSAEEIRAMPEMNVPALMAYYKTVRAETTEYFKTMQEQDLKSIVKHPSGDPSMDWTYDRVLGHVLAEEGQHLGQISYLRGMMRGINK